MNQSAPTDPVIQRFADRFEPPPRSRGRVADVVSGPTSRSRRRPKTLTDVAEPAPGAGVYGRHPLRRIVRFLPWPPPCRRSARPQPLRPMCDCRIVTAGDFIAGREERRTGDHHDDHRSAGRRRPAPSWAGGYPGSPALRRGAADLCPGDARVVRARSVHEPPPDRGRPLGRVLQPSSSPCRSRRFRERRFTDCSKPTAESNGLSSVSAWREYTQR